MEPISVDEFVKSFLKNNKGEKEADIRLKLKRAIAAKQSGATCISCGQLIWAIGSAIVEWNGCFTCITGEADSSEDYEIDTVCF